MGSGTDPDSGTRPNLTFGRPVNDPRSPEPLHCAGCRGTDYLDRPCRGRSCPPASSSDELRAALEAVLDEVSWRDDTNGRRFAYAAYGGSIIVQRIDAALNPSASDDGETVE
jgi:hypothetical protein